MWGCFLMSGVKILHFLKDWWKSTPIHQNYTMALMLVYHAIYNSAPQYIKDSFVMYLPRGSLR